MSFWRDLEKHSMMMMTRTTTGHISFQLYYKHRGTSSSSNTHHDTFRSTSHNLKEKPRLDGSKSTKTKRCHFSSFWSFMQKKRSIKGYTLGNIRSQFRSLNPCTAGFVEWKEKTNSTGVGTTNQTELVRMKGKAVKTRWWDEKGMMMKKNYRRTSCSLIQLKS